MEIFGGAIEDLPDERDFVAGEIATVALTPVDELPRHLVFDHRKVTKYSQGKTMSCTAQSACNALEITHANATGNTIDVPVLDGIGGSLSAWRYQLEVYPRTGSTSQGDYTSSGFKALVHRSAEEEGVPALTTDKKVQREIRVKVDAYAKIEKSVDLFRQWLFAGHSIGISCNVLRDPDTGESNFVKARETGWLQFPTNGEKTGGHAMAFVTGYDFREASGDGYFILAQSYGEDYGALGNGSLNLSANDLDKLHEGAYVLLLPEHISPEKKQCAKDLASCISMLRKANTLGWEESEDTKNEIVEKIAEQIRTCREFLSSE